jgi:hypothetical protein
VVCNHPCRITASATIDRGLARRLGLLSAKTKIRPYGVGTGSMHAGAGIRTLTITFGTRARRALRQLRRARLALNVRSIDVASRHQSIDKLFVTLRR